MNPLFKGNHVADANDLLFFIIEQLHKELNIVNDSNKQETNDYNYQQSELDAMDEKKMFNKFVTDYNSRNKSIVSETF